MNVILFGATGMIGRGVLLECLDHPEVKQVLTVSRSVVETGHAKLKHLIHKDFTNFAPATDRLRGYDACYFCLGVSAAGMNEQDYRRITYDYTMAAAKTLFGTNPDMTFIYVSGQGTDSSEKGSMMWARVKGKTENDLLAMGFRKALMFRPGAIIPLRGIRSRTRSYQFFYDYFGWLLALVKRISPNSVTDTTRIGLAMINAHLNEPDKKILTPADINALAGIGRPSKDPIR